ncbi:asparaginyl/glutamyl-tRNA amidotransferase subunit C [Methanocaldococcus villosus KIN24-T80]|uniref:Asparaginyl/glutamyl-tRNA amidotransferase subunit C n=1 Tax=Methanocaldococcus villosus KIN24-T80 TaxID=1069083 RepID=N6VT87_9EURY|nr:Asp-tRNA(Asn) amidotransferase subunit GatC [Methanocaldococcus villosus]ENN96411.1 asparaginyl/glutamyl-tRNA amidotransferase subunit C [Methanocaldococcus villosus KIN24-T80]
MREEAEKIIKMFSEILEKYDLEIEESYYIIDEKNVLRDDKAEPSNMREKILNIAPKVKDGYIVVEKGSWVK